MFHGELFGFQKEAFDRMIEERTLLLAYEMGLGKTVITIAAIEELIESDTVEAGLIIVPASLKYQWAKQIEKFTGGEAQVLIIDGDPKERVRQYIRARTWGEYIIVNYALLLNDWDYISKLPRDFVVCDEVTAIKNFRAKRTKKVKALDAPYRYGLTGQPVENRPEEIYSIMQWIDSRVLGRFDVFDRTFIVRNSFGGVKRYRNLPTLHKRLSEAMVRKSREDPEVRAQLPDIIEPPPRLVDFDRRSAKLYSEIAHRLQDDLAQAAQVGHGFDLWKHYGGGDEDPQALQMRGQIMSKITCMRMLCDHPDLLRESARKFKASNDPTNPSSEGGSQFAHELAERGKLGNLKKAPKFEAVVDFVTDILTENDSHKVVLFSFFKDTLNWLQDALADQTTSVLFTGDMSSREKQDSIDQFEADPNTRLFLSSDAGGYGVDLPMANYLINFDLPWSAGKLDQRNARIVRLSSTHAKVMIYNFLIRDSVEERQYAMLEQKQQIASAIVDGKGADEKGNIVVNLDTLGDFLSNSPV